MATKAKVYTVKMVRSQLQELEARKALFAILKRGDSKEINRILHLFCDHMMIQEAGKIVDWHCKAAIGSLTLRMVKF